MEAAEDVRAPIPGPWPLELAAEAKAAVALFWRTAAEEYENPDCFRIGRVENPDEMRAYVEARKAGCCGAFDECWTVGETLVLYGFHYGH